MTLKDVLAVAGLVLIALFFSYKGGEIAGRQYGYRLCVSEQDDDRPRTRAKL